MADDIEGQDRRAKDETIKRSDNGDSCSCCAGASGGCQRPTAQTWGTLRVAWEQDVPGFDPH